MSLPSAGPHDSRIRVFLDRNLTSRILLQELRKAQITKDMGLDIRAHGEEFPEFNTLREVTDAEWLEEIGQRGWLILSRDLKIQYNQAEKQAIKDSRASFFAITAKNLPSTEMARFILKAMNRIVIFAEQHNPPFIARVYRDGRIVEIEL